MSLNSYDSKLLSLCKNTQQDEAHFVVIDPDRMQIYKSSGFYSTNVYAAAESSDRFSITIPAASVNPTVQSLVSLGMLRKFGTSPAYQVTHTGWFNRSLRRKEILKMIVTHVCFPIIVTLITEAILHGIQAL